MVRRSILNRACVGKPESRNATVFLAKTGVMVPGVPYADRGNWGGARTQHCSLVTEFGVLRRKFWQVSRLICSSRIQRCRSFSERVGPWLIFLKSSQVSSCWKRSREVTTEPITVLTKIDSQWLHVATAGRRCYYLERSKKKSYCNKMN